MESSKDVDPLLISNPQTQQLQQDKRKSLKFLFIGVMLILFILVGWIVLQVKNNHSVKNVSPSTIVPNTIVVTVTSELLTPTSSYPSESIIVSKNTNMQTAIMSLFDFQLTFPNTWSIKEVNRRVVPIQQVSGVLSNQECADYVISSNDGLATLTFKPECEKTLIKSPGEEYDLLPADSVTIKDEYNPWVRYYDPQKNEYHYVREINTQYSQPAVVERIRDDAIFLSDSKGGSAISINLSYSGNDSLKNKYLKESDNIVASLQIYHTK